MTKFGISQPVRRLEDARLITGRGIFTDDITAPGELKAYVLRSALAHARIVRIDVAAALQAPGVQAVLLGRDFEATGSNSIPVLAPVKNSDGSLCKLPKRHVLATDKVRHVGDGVAFVVARTREEAQAAAELIEVDYQPLDAVIDTALADRPGQPAVHDEVARNVVFDWHHGDARATEDAFAAAAHRVRRRIVNNRVVVCAMEPRAALAVPDPKIGRITLHTGTQGPWHMRDILARDILKVPAEAVRVRTPDVGGAFGMKTFTYPELAMVAWAAQKLKKPVKWTADRSESFLSDTMGRDNVTDAELAFDAQGRILAFRTETRAAMGAYLSNFAPYIPKAGLNVAPGVYDVKQFFTRVIGVLTNTVPVDAYRGAGRPEAIYVIERMMDAAADELEIDPADLRRRNFISPAAMPFRTVVDNLYDSGEFDRIMTRALEAADAQGIAARRAEARRRGRLRGFGFCSYIESIMGPKKESAAIRFEADGRVAIYAGTQTGGQGHETAYAQILHEALGVPIDKVHLIQGDTDLIPAGGGTGGSRSVTAQGLAIQGAAQEVLKKAREAASAELEAAPSDLEFRDGAFSVVGTDRRVGLMDLAARAGLPDGGNRLDGQARTEVPAWTFPNGCHVAEVDIDEDTGHVQIVRYTIVDDFGRIINPLLLAGQIHGGVVQGIGQALYEHTAFAEDGQLLSGSFMDYALPLARDVPFLHFETIEVLTKNNAIGMKGAGEAGTVGAPAAVMNAVQDALSAIGIKKHIDMPATPWRVWQAIRTARTG